MQRSQVVCSCYASVVFLWFNSNNKCNSNGKVIAIVIVREVIVITRSTQRAQTSLAEADHYSHIAHCKNVEP